MDFSQLQSYLIPAAVVLFLAWRFWKFYRVKNQLPALLEQGGIVVDVRSRAEFAGGSREGSINIPLDEMDKGSETLNRDKPVVVCCASGTRSAMAAAVLKRKGFKTVVNAGSWRNTV
ncbi:MAG: rhodanese-like domain-containing protein [Bdellovibrionota bacterium]